MPKLFIVVRADLPYNTSAAQVGHAIAEFSIKYPKDFQCWHEASNTIVVLQVPDILKLVEVIDRANFEAVRYASFHEPDLKNELTAIAFEPAARTSKLLRKLDLLID